MTISYKVIMKRNISTFIAVVIILFTISGCNGIEQQEIDLSTIQSEIYENLMIGEVPQEYEFNLSNENVYSFTITDAGDIYAVTESNNLAKYTGSGELIEEYNNAKDLSVLDYYDNKIYGYNYKQSRIDVYDLNNKKQSSITNKFNLDIIEIKDLIVLKETAYILITPSPDYDNEEILNHYGEQDEKGYSDFNEKLYKINLETGEYQELAIKNIISIYLSTSGDLFYYGYEGETYNLYMLDLKTDTSTIISCMDDVGYIFAFIYEIKNFTYIDSSYDLKNKKITDNLISKLEENIYSGPGSNIWLYAGHFIYLNIPYYTINTSQDENINAEINSVYIGYLYEDLNIANEKENKEEKTGELVISDYEYYNSLNTVALRKETGISATIEAIPLDDVLFLTELMAGNQNIDIYIFNSAHYATRILKEKGFYVPLNTSKEINTYVDACFDYLGESAKTSDNDIWAIPLVVDTDALWYVPKNFELFKLTYKDVEYFDNLMQTLESIYYQTNGYNDYAIYSYVNNFYPDCYIQYEMKYNNYNDNIINFNTDLFKKIIKTLYNDWDRQIDPNGNNLFKPSFMDSVFDERGLSTIPEYDINKVIFKFESILSATNNLVFLEDWRLLPEPKISSDINFNAVRVKYAVINPYSENKGLALNYLETVVKNPHGLLKNPCFTQENIEFYKDEFDTSIPAFSDIYDICKNGEIYYRNYPASDETYIDDYQKKHLTLDEAVLVKQREVEMWLNE